MTADARVLLARAQTQTPPLSTIDRFENGGLPVQSVLYQQTLVLYRIFTKTLREECSGVVYHGYRYRAPISVIVNYLNDTTVGQYRLTL